MPKKQSLPMIQPNRPTIEIEDEKGEGYLVLCWEDARYDLDEFIFEPGVVYALTERTTNEETFLLVVGYEFLPLDTMRKAIEKQDVQVDLIIRWVIEKGPDLVASPHLTRYRFPECLNHDLSPDRFIIEALAEGVVEAKGTVVPTLKAPAPIQAAVKIVEEKKKKTPIDLTHTDLGQLNQVKNKAKKTPIVPPKSITTIKENKAKLVPIPIPVRIPVPVPTPLSQPEKSTMVIRTDDMRRVQKVLLHWVEIAKANSNKELQWAIVHHSYHEFKIIRGEDTILNFNHYDRLLSTELTTKQLKDEFELMTNGIMSCQLETAPIHEVARHIFVRSTSFTESSIYDLLLHMLSIKKVGFTTKSRS